MDPSNSGAAAGAVIFQLITIGMSIVTLVAMWKVFDKAGKPGWACIIPIYNLIVMAEIADKPFWWALMFFVPIANIVFPILLAIGIAEQFGKGAGFGVGMAFLPFIFYPILAFGDAEYQSYSPSRIPRTL